MTQPLAVASQLLRGATLAVLLLAAGCTTVLVRSAVPEEAIETAAPYGIDTGQVRLWGDSLSGEMVEFVRQSRTAAFSQANAEDIAAGRTIENDIIAFSGGGPDGAFGAGLLAGWTARGDRPEFHLVTGVSTGAILALYAYLGPEYDETLREIYTTFETDDLVTPAIFAGLTAGTALLDARGYRDLIERYIDDAIIAKLAEEHRKDRILLLGTTNIDASRPVIWNIGAIADSGHPQAKRLIHDVIQASSAIPAAFPPVLIPVIADGKRHDEMHVDGGATAQVVLFSPQLRFRDLDEALEVQVNRRIWIVINNQLKKPYGPVRPRVFSIAAKAASSLIGGSGNGDVYRIFAIAQRDGADLNIVSIPRSFALVADEPFDPAYMGALYDLGAQIGLEGESWNAYPPDFAPPLEAAEGS
ncbi:MAG: patatin-like phospholipase family protein [Pseudomonadota bacterium]